MPKRENTFLLGFLIVVLGCKRKLAKFIFVISYGNRVKKIAALNMCFAK